MRHRWGSGLRVVGTPKSKSSERGGILEQFELLLPAGCCPRMGVRGDF